ncbi:MAG: cytochrome-c oxidase, cbb3-type subunit III [Rhodospirillales bacterium]|nr:cytochrome-c oxidase, cbb3-type subunit III [Rhodospirillales bacterium]
MAGTPEKDAISGVETTGHEWDGIKELNNPLPRWWAIIFYLTIVWAAIYAIFMPAVPLFGGFTQGVLDWSSRGALSASMQEAVAEQKPYLDKIQSLSPAQIAGDRELAGFVQAGGKSAFLVNCSPCHGQGAQGSPGYPNLNDDAWIWGGTPEDINHTITYGIRNAHEESRQNVMAAYGRDGLLSPAEIDAVTEYVLSLSGRSGDPEAVEKGKPLFENNCVSCHREGGAGDTELGAPNLTDAIWLYGGSKAKIIETLTYGRAGMMPAWEGRLSDDTIKLLTVYVHALGGGQ